MNVRPRSVRHALALLLAAAVLAAGCGTSGGEASDDTTTTTEATTTTAAEEEPEEPEEDGDNPFTYEVGQCFDPDGTTADDDALVDCDTPHRYEVVGIVDSPFDVIPDDADDQLKVACAEVLDEYLGDDEGVGDGIQVTNLTVSGDVGDEVAGTDDDLAVCIGEAPDGLALTGSIEGGAADALDPYVAIMQMPVGDCFTLYEDFFYVGLPTSCADGDDALLNLGTYELDFDEYPGQDELLDLRDTECARLAEDLDLPNAEEASGIVPSPEDWLVGVRSVTCDVPMSG